MTVLRCSDAEGLIFDVFPGELSHGFNERHHYRFSPYRADMQLYVDDAPLDAAASDDGIAWLWEPGFYAGEVTAELIDSAGLRVAYYRLDVSPANHKLGKESFAEMVEEILEFDPRLLLGSEAAKSSVGVEGGDADPLLEYARLRQHGQRLLAALAVIVENPVRKLRHERALRKFHEVKKLDSRSVRSALLGATTLSAVGSAGGTSGTHEAALFDVPQVREDMDCPANQTLTAALRSVIRRVNHVSDALQEMANTEIESDTRTSLRSRVQRRRSNLADLGRALRRMEKQLPFSSVARAETTAAGLNAIAAHPVYATAFRKTWQILRPGVDGESRDESMWISPTWEIYERWCFLQIVQILRERHPELNWTKSYPTSRFDCVRFVAVGDRKNISIWLQARCPAFDQTPFHDFQSVSGERRPDIVVTFDDGATKKLLVFDAKYRTSRAQVLDGMQSAHVYRDCLRWKESRPILSLLLVPRGGGAAWLEGEQIRAQEGIGVIQLGSSDDLSALKGLFDVQGL